MTHTSPGHQTLSDTELDRLDRFLSGLQNESALSLEAMDGFFCALIAGPDFVAPSEYLPILWGGELADADAFASLEEANATLALIMRHWNSILAELEEGDVHVPLVDQDAEIPGRDWARGFMRGARLRWADWKGLFIRDDEAQLLTIPIVAGEVDPDWPKEPLTEEKRQELLTYMGAGFLRAYRYFERERHARAGARGSALPVRRESKIGRNAPCPCGSGRKYKRCCGAHDSSLDG